VCRQGGALAFLGRSAAEESPADVASAFRKMLSMLIPHRNKANLK
jgi:hypothetical protein